jgi:hypothetical protein
VPGFAPHACIYRGHWNAAALVPDDPPVGSGAELGEVRADQDD